MKTSAGGIATWTGSTTMLVEFFKPEAPPKLSERLLGSLRARPAGLDDLADKFRIEATERGVARLSPGRGDHGASARARAHAERARQELREYLAGRRTFFTVAVDLDGMRDFQARVLAEASRIPFGEVDSYCGSRSTRGPSARRPGGRQRARGQSGPGDRPLPSHRPRRRHLGSLRLRRRDEDPAAAARAHDAGADRLHEHADHLPARLRPRAAGARDESRRLRLGRPTPRASAIAPAAVCSFMRGRRGVNARRVVGSRRCDGCRVALLAVLGTAAPAAAQLPIFDAHIHYSRPDWGVYSPERALVDPGLGRRTPGDRLEHARRRHDEALREGAEDRRPVPSPVPDARRHGQLAQRPGRGRPTSRNGSSAGSTAASASST